MREYRYYVYIMASRSRTLYIGFTSDLPVRVRQHKNDVYDGFSKQYQCHRLVHFETFGDAVCAISREKQLKRWSRMKKIAIIAKVNPGWADLSEDWGKPLEPWRGTAGLSAPAQERASGRDDSFELGVTMSKSAEIDVTESKGEIGNRLP